MCIPNAPKHAAALRYSAGVCEVRRPGGVSSKTLKCTVHVGARQLGWVDQKFSQLALVVVFIDAVQERTLQDSSRALLRRLRSRAAAPSTAPLAAANASWCLMPGGRGY